MEGETQGDYPQGSRARVSSGRDADGCGSSRPEETPVRRRHQSRSFNETSAHTKHLDGLYRVGRILYGKGERKHSCTKNEKVRKNASATFRGGGVEGRGGLTSLTQEELLKPEKGQQP